MISLKDINLIVTIISNLFSLKDLTLYFDNVYQYLEIQWQYVYNVPVFFPF